MKRLHWSNWKNNILFDKKNDFVDRMYKYKNIKKINNIKKDIPNNEVKAIWKTKTDIDIEEENTEKKDLSTIIKESERQKKYTI